MASPLTNAVSRLAQIISDHSRIVTFTGAGISTESGISDYRSKGGPAILQSLQNRGQSLNSSPDEFKGGIWDRFQPVTIQEFLASEEKRKLYWERKSELFREMSQAEPNAAHLAIAELDRQGKLHGLITQNIDGLHHRAGVRTEKIVELHGTNREIICLSCNDKTTWQETLKCFAAGEYSPTCKKCGGWLKPNTISFGQALDPRTLDRAAEWSTSCDAMIAVGSTLIVEPAASFPRIAKDHGACLVIINLTETPLDTEADLVIHEKAGEILGQAVSSLKK